MEFELMCAVSRTFAGLGPLVVNADKGSIPASAFERLAAMAAQEPWGKG